MKFSFGQSQHDCVEIDVLGYERSPVGDYHDDNWLTVKASVSVGGFRGSVDAAILTDELAAFRDELCALYENLKSPAEFTTLERQIYLKLAGDGKGQIELVGEIADQPGIGNRLHFASRFDQSQLRASIREIERVTTEFPVREV
jgi:hypothetical protein